MNIEELLEDLNSKEERLLLRAVGLKRCSCCKQIKDLESDFHDNRSSSDGKVSRCKDCISKRDKKRKENGGNWTESQKEQIHENSGHKCYICGSTKNLEADHIMPQSLCKQGMASKYLENGASCCKSCNVAKRHKLIYELIMKIPKHIRQEIALDWVIEEANAWILQESDNLKRNVEPNCTIGGKSFIEIKVKEPSELQAVS